MARHPTDHENPLVLVALNDEASRKAVRATLERSAMRMLPAPSLEEVKDLVARMRPNAALIESGGPDLAGLEVCKAIRNSDEGREIPVIVVVDRDDADTTERAYQAGASGIIEKPVALATLPYRIRNALRTARSLSDLTGLVRAIPDLIFIVNEDGEVQHGLSGPDATHTLQIKALATAHQINFYPCENDDTAIACIGRALETGKPQVYEHVLDALDIHLETRFVARDKHTVLAIVRDITERKNAEAEIYNLAYYDELTELYRTANFSARASREQSSGRRRTARNLPYCSSTLIASSGSTIRSATVSVTSF